MSVTVESLIEQKRLYDAFLLVLMRRGAITEQEARLRRQRRHAAAERGRRLAADREERLREEQEARRRLAELQREAGAS